MFPVLHHEISRLIDVSNFATSHSVILSPMNAGPSTIGWIARRAEQPLCGLVGAMVSVNDFSIRPARVMTRGDVLSTCRRFRFISTPHVPHGWDAGVLFEESERILFVSYSRNPSASCFARIFFINGATRSRRRMAVSSKDLEKHCWKPKQARSPITLGIHTIRDACSNRWPNTNLRRWRPCMAQLITAMEHKHCETSPSQRQNTAKQPRSAPSTLKILIAPAMIAALFRASFGCRCSFSRLQVGLTASVYR